MTVSKERIALFIDADNAPAKKIDMIISELAKYGVVNIRKAYGNWKNGGLIGWEKILHEYAISPVQQFDLTKGKNATDMAMTIDAMDVMFRQSVDAFCIVSSDCDFTPLVMRLRAEGKRVIGFGERKTPSPFVNSCTPFLFLNDVIEPVCIIDESVDVAPETTSTTKTLKCDTKLINLLRHAIDAAQQDDGWSNLALVGHHIANQSSFDPRNYGYKKLGDLIRSIDLFDTKMSDNGYQMFVKDNRKIKLDS